MPIAGRNNLDELLAQIRRALEIERNEREARLRADESGKRLAALTPKEREVLDLIASGKTNREMADELGLSLRAVEDRQDFPFDLPPLGIRPGHVPE